MNSKGSLYNMFLFILSLLIFSMVSYLVVIMIIHSTPNPDHEKLCQDKGMEYRTPAKCISISGDEIVRSCYIVSMKDEYLLDCSGGRK